jgi:hypothetical protein
MREIVNACACRSNIEGMRSKLKRLVARGLITEAEPGLFALQHQ